MSSLLFECTICSEDYNSTSKAPMNLPCGHTVCLSCLGKLLEEKNKRCPQCRVAFPKGKVKLGSFSRNYFALNAISDRDARVYGLCDIHSEPKIWACLTDRKKICQECYENAAHKKHKIEPADKIREQADQKKSKLESKLKDVENSIQQSFNLLKEEENVVSKLLQAQYDEGLMMMNKRQQQIKLLVKDFFGLKKTETENALEADLDKTKNSLEYKINMLTNPSSEEKFFHVLEEPEPEILIINKKQDELKKEVQALQQTIKTSYESCFKDVNHLMHTLYVKLQGKQQPPSLSLPSAHSSSALVITNQNAPQTDPPTIEISQITHINEFGSSTQEVYASKAQDIPKKIKNALNLHKLENASRIIIEFQPGLEDEDVNSFCKIVFGKMKTVTEIRSLKLKLSKTQITEKSAEILFDYLVNFKRLDRLRFCLKETAQGFVYALVNTLMKSLEFPGFKPTSVGIYSCLELDKETLGLIDKMKKNFPKTVYESEKCLFHLT